MSILQRFVIAATFIIMLIAFLYPPWHDQRENAMGHHFIADKPYVAAHIDKLQWGAIEVLILIIGGAALWVLNRKKD